MDREFIVIAKLLGVLLDSSTGEPVGAIDASDLLPAESAEALAEQIARSYGQHVLDEQRAALEKLWTLPAFEKPHG